MERIRTCSVVVSVLRASAPPEAPCGTATPGSALPSMRPFRTQPENTTTRPSAPTQTRMPLVQGHAPGRRSCPRREPRMDALRVYKPPCDRPLIPQLSALPLRSISPEAFRCVRCNCGARCPRVGLTSACSFPLFRGCALANVCGVPLSSTQRTSNVSRFASMTAGTLLTSISDAVQCDDRRCWPAMQPQRWAARTMA